MRKKILITTGGSGGHVKPAIALYEHLNERFDVIYQDAKKRGLLVDANKRAIKRKIEARASSKDSRGKDSTVANAERFEK